MDIDNKENIIEKSDNKHTDEELNQINTFIENFDFETAKILLLNRLKKDSEDVEALDILSEVYVSLDEAKEAIKIIKKSISLEPEKNPEKYMTLGQLSDYKHALNYYQKGIELYLKELKEIEFKDNINNTNEVPKIRNCLASAYAAVGELYMTSDLW
jgi:tetratricopeptide (TPR) repeat protein